MITMKPLVLLLTLTTASFVANAEGLPPGHPPIDAGHSNAHPKPALLPQKAKVLDVIDVAQYTYLEVKQGNESRWLAAPSVAVKKGDIVRFDNGMLMKDFHSSSLDRTFPSIYFVSSVELTSEPE
ncbi:MAG: hypothetical protein NTV43_12925 [Methylococcales bacterium]|nr:hypothetical protein [Methylococcales bacterium]